MPKKHVRRKKQGKEHKRQQKKPHPLRRRIIKEQKVKEQKAAPKQQNVETKPSPKAQKAPEEQIPWVLDVSVYRSPTISKNPALRSVHGSLTFKLADGRELQNLVDLARALEEMADDVFFHHANIEKNDFSSWLRDVFDLDGLADAVRTASKPEMRERVYKHLLEEVMK